MATVWIITYIYASEFPVDSVWSTKEEATKRLGELDTANWEIDEWQVAEKWEPESGEQ